SSVDVDSFAPLWTASAMAQTPASWPSLVDQLLREGIELRNRGDTKNATERLQEAFDSEPNNVAVLAELAKTYDLILLYARANDMWRNVSEGAPRAVAAHQSGVARLRLGWPSPAAARMPPSPVSPSREVTPPPKEPAAVFKNPPTNPRKHETDQAPPLPTST